MLHTQTVEPITLGLLKKLMADDALGQFNLVGGTALSLQIGHRKSIDLDMFSQSDFEADTVLQHLTEAGYEPQVTHLQKQTLIGSIQGIKVDFIRFRYPFANAVLVVDGIRMANIKDIACMKIDAIMGRGRKKDFFDLYFLLQHFTLPDIMGWYAEMFKHSTLFHVYKSLTWFEDADLDGEIDAIDKKINWQKVKKTIVKAVEKAI
jgi:Nucleotidyl transferase AbiEii toxin, Type IV TA system